MRLARLWILGTIAGALGAIVMYDALPGINWPLWVVVAVAGLLVYRRPDVPTLRAVALPLGFAIILVSGAAITTAPLLLFAIVVIVASLLGLTVTLAYDPAAARSYGAVEILTAPFRAFARSLDGLGSAMLASIESAGTARRHPVLRGSLIAAPVVIVFALLFASADPLLARARDTVYDALTTWGDIPRIVFGLLLTLFVVGAYTASLQITSGKTTMPSSAPTRIGLTERRIVIGSAAAISWLFVLLQISYLFGTAPDATGSGVTFAEYARRGFGELAVAATAAVLLIVAAHPRASSSDEPATHSGLVVPALVLLAAVGCILVSAFHRVSLYENAYGFTTMRVYAQAYMVLILMILVALAWRVRHAFDVRAFARDVMTVSLITLTVLVYWNGDAWVARANVDRFTRTDKLDVAYLTRGLSPDAYPTLVQSLSCLPSQQRTQLGVALAHEYARRPNLRADGSWYEWNSRRTRARSALLTLGPPPPPPRAAPF